MNTPTKILTDEQIETAWHRYADTAEAGKRRNAFGRAIEAAVLQSPEVVAWKRDSERYRWLLRNYLSFNLCDEAWKHGSLDAAFDAAMEVKP